MSDELPSCLECGSKTHAVLVLESAHNNRHALLEYAAANARPGFWLGRYPSLGYVGAEMCESCGRIAFRAWPKEPV